MRLTDEKDKLFLVFNDHFFSLRPHEVPSIFKDESLLLDKFANWSSVVNSK